MPVLHRVLVVLALLMPSATARAADSVVVFNEVMYNPAVGPGDGATEAVLEWVELHNQMAVDVDISGWSISDGVRFTFPDGTIVSGGGFLVIAASPKTLAAAGVFEGALGPFVGRLENAGERLELRDNNNRLMDSVAYNDGGRWPVAPDGCGASLSKRVERLGSSRASSWTSSARSGGTPGAPNFAEPETASAFDGLRFSEYSLGDGGTWIELTSSREEPLSLSGALSIRLSGDPGGELDFADAEPGALVVPAGGQLVLSAAELGFELAADRKLFLVDTELDACIDAVRLRTASRARADAIEGAPWLIASRPTPGAANEFELRDEIVINEIMYHHQPTLDRAEETETEVVFDVHSEWRYEQSGADLGTAWREPDFDDSSWPVGRALFFNESADLPGEKNTELALGVLTYYFRTEIDASVLEDLERVGLRTIVDDGVVVYLNGVEIHRNFMPDGEITAATRASRSVGNAAWSGPFEIPADALVPGRNVLAAEVHQITERSNDVAFGLELLEIRTVSEARSYEESGEEWLELHNRGDAPVDISGWRFDNGIRYEFSDGTVMAPGDFLLLTNDRESLARKYPETRILGDYEGVLSNASDRLELVDADGKPADELRYHDRGRWPSAADGDGASIELRDPRADNASPEAWAASDETGGTGWRQISYGGIARPNLGPLQWNEFICGLLDEGEVLLDDISVVMNPTSDAVELITNGDLESGDAGWRVLGTHERTSVIVDPDDPGNHVLHVVATGATEHMHNHIETTLAGNMRIAVGREYRISFRARWLSGSNQLNTRLYFNWLPMTHVLDRPARNGTPGAPNSTLEENIGPTYESLTHAPVLPRSDESVTVSIHARDPDGVDSMTLWWTDWTNDWTATPMARATGDETDGQWRGEIPWRGNRTVSFHVEGRDARGAASLFPTSGRDSGAMFKAWDATASNHPVHTVRILMTPEHTARLYEITNVMSNAGQPATVILDETDVRYDARVRLRGSERGRPVDARVSFHITLDPAEPYRGVHRTISIDRSGGWNGSIPFGSQDEIVIKHIANHAGGIPAMYDDIIHVLAPRPTHSGRALLLMARFTSTYLDAQFEDGADGSKYTYELIYYPTSTINGRPDGLKRPQPDSVQGTDHRDLGDDKEAYRWLYLLENNVRRDDFTPIQRFGRALGMNGPEFLDAIEDAIDVDQWTRAFAFYSLCGVGDTYMSGNFHNNIYYERPSDGRLLVFPWDMDFAFVNSPSHAVVWNQHAMRKVFQIPVYTRRYYAHLLDMIDSTFNRTYLAPWIAHYGALDRVNFNVITNYVISRERFVRNSIPRQVPLAITTNDGADFTTEEATIELSGTSWIDVAELVLEARPTARVEWPTVTRWRIEVELEPGPNELQMLAFDDAGNLIGAESITVTLADEEPFLRGDVDLDGRLNVTDPVTILGHLFRGLEIDCDDAADVNDDGALNLTDAIALLDYLFRQGAPPAAPFPARGTDPNDDDLECERGARE